MVKPAMPYLDIIAEARNIVPNYPLACYQVSGEFAMIHAGARAGVYDLKTMAFESANCMLRAGELHIKERDHIVVSACRRRMSLPTSPFISSDNDDSDSTGCTLILTYFTPDFLDWLSS